MLLSNGLHHSENLPVKFGFSLKIVPATIAKKLPLQLRPKPLFIAFFSLSHKRPTFAFTGESGYTLGFRRKIAHNGPHGETGGVSDGGGITTLGAFRTFTNIPGPGIRTANFAALGDWSRVLPKNAESLGTAMRLCASLFRGVAAPLGCVICLQLGDVAVFFTLCAVLSERARWGWYHYPRSVPHVSETLRGQGVERQTLPLLDLGRGRSRRTQKAFGTAMRSCASLFRGVAAPLGCVIFLQFGDVAVFSLCAQHFLNVRGEGGITTLGALCVLLKYRTAACQNGSFAVF